MPTYAGADGSPLHYDVLGDVAAKPLIALAGGAARHPEYLGDLAGLSAVRPLAVPHQRGVGRSPVPRETAQGSFWRQAADVDRLREHLRIGKALVVGHSAGTRLAIAYAAQFPDRLSGMVLITPPSTWLVDQPSDAETIRGRREEPAVVAASAALQEGPRLAGEDDEEEFHAWQWAVAPVGYGRWGTAEQAHARAARYHLAAARAFFTEPPPSDLPARLRRVEVPVLVIAGAEDGMTGVGPALALAGLFPQGHAVVLDGCGHYPWVEQPRAFRDAVDGFLDHHG